MSFLDKVQFWKKKEDFSSMDFSLPPSNSTQMTNGNQPRSEFDSSKYQMPQDPYMPRDPLAPEPTNAQGFSQNNMQSTDPSQAGESFTTSNEPSPFQPIQSDNMSEQNFGRRLAQKYVSQEETQVQQQNQSMRSPQSEELLHLKIDAMKSEISLVNQRLQKIEHLLEAQVKQRGRY